MKLTAQDLEELGVIDGIIEEPKGGAHKNPVQLYCNLDRMLLSELSVLENKSGGELERARYKKFRNMDEQFRALGGSR